MRWLTELWNRINALLLGARADRESQEEMRHHLDLATEKHMRAGLSPAAARRKAALAFGSLPAAREGARDARGARFLEDVLRDLAHGLRQLARRPMFTVVTVLTIALGIGAVTAIWSVVDGVLLRPIPFDDPDALVVVWQTDRHTGTTREPSSWPDFVDLGRDAASLAQAAALFGQERTYLPMGGGAERLVAIATTSNYFSMLGISPLLGRAMTSDESRPGGSNVAMLGETFWRARFAADPSVLGRIIVLDDEPHEVVGVMPSAAGFALDPLHARAAYHATYVGGRAVDVWLPIQADEATFPRFTHPFLVLGRLAADADLLGARREIEALAATLEATYPQSNTARGMFVEPLSEVAFAEARPILLLLAAAVSLVLIVAFVNVANLLLAHGTHRVREIAVRSALGAGIGRIARQLLVENALLTALGAASGVALAAVALKLLLVMAPADVPRLEKVGIDLRVLAVTFIVSVLGALVFALVPTLQARRVDVARTIQGAARSLAGDRRGHRVRQILVIAELALSVTLVVSAVLLTRSLWSVLAVDPGFRAAGIMKAQFRLPESRYPRDFSRWPHFDEVHGFNQRLLEGVSAQPGVASAALAASHPLDPGFTNSFLVVGREDEAADWPEISVRMVSPSYFATLGVGVRSGRPLSDADHTDAPATAVINRAAAERFFPGQEPIGQSIRFWGTDRRIVGVVENERFHGLTEAPPIAVYASLMQVPSNNGVLFVRTSSGDPLLHAEGASAMIRELDPGLAVYGVERLTETLSESVSTRRFAMVILLTMAGVTLALALIGVHGVLSYATAERTREIGIRTLLGASRGEVAGLMVGSGLRMAAIGVSFGLLGALALSRLLKGMLYGVAERDLATYAAVSLAMLAAASFATWLPARRAARIDAVEALRAE